MERMARLLRVNKQSPTNAVLVDETSMMGERWTEPVHLEKWIVDFPEVLDPSLKVVSNQFNRWRSDEGNAKQRLDILALSSSGELVVIELKRNQDVVVHLQALTYAALVSGFDRQTLAGVHRDWLKSREGRELTHAEALRELEDWVDGEWDDESLRLPRMILVAEGFPDQVITTVQWLSEAAPDLAIEAFEYHLFDSGDDVDVTFQRLLPIDDLGGRRLRPQLAEVRQGIVDKRRNARSVLIIHDAELIPDGAPISLDLTSLVKPEVIENVTRWLSEDLRRSNVTWRNHRTRPLRWAAADDPEQSWTPTRLCKEIFAKASVSPPAFSAAVAWTYGGDSLARIASRHLRGGLQPEEDPVS